MKAIINSDSVILLDSNHRSIKEFIPELKVSVRQYCLDTFCVFFDSVEDSFWSWRRHYAI